MHVATMGPAMPDSCTYSEYSELNSCTHGPTAQKITDSPTWTRQSEGGVLLYCSAEFVTPAFSNHQLVGLHNP